MTKASRMRQAKWISALLSSSVLFGAMGGPAMAQVATGPVQPLYGKLRPFFGTIDPSSANSGTFFGNLTPFYGKLRPFFGDVSAFYGPLSPFYGKLRPYSGSPSPFTATTDPSLLALYGSTDPFWGAQNPYLASPSSYVVYSQIAPFWNTEFANYTGIVMAWQLAKLTGNYTAVAAALQSQIIDPASSFWNPAISKATRGATAGGIATSLLTAAGVTYTGSSINAASLANVSTTDQAMFFLNYYDRLMTYAGTGHVDWWMGATGWSPSLATIATTHSDDQPPVTVGMLDFTVTKNVKNQKGTVLQLGSNVFSDGHGASVGSLIVGSADGSNIMGVLPKGAGKVVVYDPYDATNTTNWTDVGTGLAALASMTTSKVGAPTGVINASLGVPGWTLNPGWNDALAAAGLASRVLVVAAGNEGAVQTANVPWNFAKNPTLLIVGSVGLDGTISNFSNQPGEACLLDTASSATACTEANKLKYRFITAPGELILVSDGSGTPTRQSGTSLAAPLVTGAVALLQARWPWLANYSPETAQIILQSATKVGTNPGADPVYGAGIVNIKASQSPLNWSALKIYPVVNGKKASTAATASSLVTTVTGGSQSTWDAQNLSYTAFETIGRTYRDFYIPLSSKLVGQTAGSQDAGHLFQDYLSSDLKAWVAAGAHFSDPSSAAPRSSGFMQSSLPMGRVMGMEMRMKMVPNQDVFGYKPSNVPYRTEVALIGAKSSFHVGFGDGAAALDGMSGFAQASDHDVRRGGANPLLGLASGGSFMNVRSTLFRGLTISAGFSHRRDEREAQQFGVSSPAALGGARTYEASAEHLAAEFKLTDRVLLQTGLTRLRETSGLLGVQSVDVNDLHRGAVTTGATAGVDVSLDHGVTVTASGTTADTRTDQAQNLRATAAGLQSSAAELAISKFGVVSDHDRIRLTLARSMKVDRGQLQFSSVGVVDRETGALGVINQTLDPSVGRQPISVELMYARSLTSLGADLSVFVRADANRYVAPGADTARYMAGGQFRIAF